MKAIKITLLTVVSLILVWGCASTPPAPTSASGNPYVIKVMCSKGNPPEEHQKSYDEMHAWMQQDLVNQLNQAGYSAEIISSEDEYTSGEGKYLLLVEMVKYNPGSSAARIIVGFGAGSASLDNSYKLYSDKRTPDLEWTDGAGSSGHWTRIPRKLNTNTVKRINQKLSE